MAERMNAWGPAGCREHEREIVAHLRAAYKKTDWHQVLTASQAAITSGLAMRLVPLNPLALADPIGALLGKLIEEAIRRAELAADG